MDKIDFFSTFVNIKSAEDLLKAIEISLKETNNSTFFCLNSYSFYLCESNSEFREAFNKSNYITADGTSMVWGLKILKNIRVKKVAVAHYYFNKLGFYFSEQKVKLALVGAKESVVLSAAKKIRENFPCTNICSAYSGFFDKKKEIQIFDDFAQKKPDIIFVGMGMPESEIWISNNLDKFNAKIIFSVGGLIDMLGDEQKLAPSFLYNTGFEWVYRLAKNPKRLYKRYFLANTYFVYTVLRNIIKKKSKQK